MRVPIRAAGMPLLIGLLVVTFAIAADLAHEAWSTALSQQQTAERAGRDFVRYTATSVAYQAHSAIDLGLRMLFAPLNARATFDRLAPAPELLEHRAAQLRECACAPQFVARYYFRLRLDDGDLVVSNETPTPEERRWLRDTIITHARGVRDRDWDAALVVGRSEADRQIVAYATPSRNGRVEYAYGFVSDAAAFASSAFAARWRTRRAVELIPSAARHDSLMRTLVLAPDGEPIYDASPRRPELRVTMVPRAGHESYLPGVAPLAPVTLFADTVALDARYGGLRIDVALATNEPGELVGGAMPRSRLFALFGLLVLMAGLVVAVVLQLRREHEIARLRADLTAGVSHELRTPLAQILLFGETLMFERTRSERERRAAAEVIVRETRRLMHLVENALHFTRADRDLVQPSAEVIELGEVTREILVSFAPLAWAARVKLREIIDDAAPARIDAAAYRQIVLNLLENAVRYGPLGQTITVRVEHRDVVTRLMVEDEGPGIPIADRERIFAPFVRLTSSRRGVPGTGIGLAVVRDLTVRHGGRVWVERVDRPAGGARFVVELPSGVTPRKDSGQEDPTAAKRAAL
jgi:signal transduction histidine kinase